VSDVVPAAVGTWRPTALTDALLAPPMAAPVAGSVDRLRTDLVRELTAVVADLPVGDQLVLDAYRLRMATTDPERCGLGEEFAPSARLTRRAIGVAALARWVRGYAGTPSTAVRDVLGAGLDDLTAAGDPAMAGGVRPPWWAEWYSALGVGGRAVVEAEAVTWATQLTGALAWERVDPPAVVGGRDDWWSCPGARQLTLKGRAELRVPLADAGGRQALLVVSSGIPEARWRTELGFTALVATLVRGERAAPVRAVGWWPACGQYRVLETESPTLADAADAVVAAAATWVDALIERRRVPARSVG
jgi:hypothetical protein